MAVKDEKALYEFLTKLIKSMLRLIYGIGICVVIISVMKDSSPYASCLGGGMIGIGAWGWDN